jgi:hypothetical protein
MVTRTTPDVCCFPNFSEARFLLGESATQCRTDLRRGSVSNGLTAAKVQEL